MSTARHVTLAGYFITYGVLALLAVLTFVLALAELGAWAMPVALVLATTKAVLVALVFMHLLEEPAASTFAVVSAFVLVIVLVVLTVADVETRHPNEGAPMLEGP